MGSPGSTARTCPSGCDLYGDLLQTRSDSIANINLPGSPSRSQPIPSAQFEGSSLDIEHGGVTVSTLQEASLTIRPGDVKSRQRRRWTESTFPTRRNRSNLCPQG